MTGKLFTRNFTLLILGQASSLFGNAILRLALSMHILERTGSAAVFAGLLSAAAVPTILLAPLGGILADRLDKRRIMVTLDALTGASVLLSAALLQGGNDIAVIAVLLFVLSVLGAFETPTVQACIPFLLEGGSITKGNAAVGQVASLSGLVAPMLGGILYAMFGLEPMMSASAACFFATAGMECFIRISRPPAGNGGGVLATLKADFTESLRFLFRERGDILKLLALAALCRFFVMGVAVVGLPYLVRTVLGLGAGYYGAAESALAVAAILGSVAAGLLAGRMGLRWLAALLASLGVFLFPAGLAFLLPVGTAARYIASVISFCGMQMAAGIFSIFAVSLIQQGTPRHLMGKVMAYAAAIPLCAQPIGQVVYGILFDCSGGALYAVLLPTGVVVCLIGIASAGFFRGLEEGAAGQNSCAREETGV